VNHAAWNNHPEVIEYLLSQGLDVEDAPAGAAVPLLPEFLRTPGANTLVNAYAGLTRAASRRLVLSIARGALEIEGSVE